MNRCVCVKKEKEKRNDKNSDNLKYNATFLTSDHLSLRVPGTWAKYVKTERYRRTTKHNIKNEKSTENLNNGLSRDAIAKDAI